MVRDYIAGHGDAFTAIIHDKAFSERFTVKGEALKSVPKGYDANHPQAEYLKNKSWYLEYPVSDPLAADANGLVEQAAQVYRIMKPFNDYLNAALKDFKMPAR